MDKKTYCLSLDTKRDKEVIEKLEKTPNKIDYIRNLIRKDIGKPERVYRYKQATGKRMNIAKKQVYSVKKLKANGKFESLPNSVKIVGELRCKYPTVTQTELTKVYRDEYNKSISKQKISINLKRIEEEANEI